MDTFACFIDMRKAFDTIDRTSLLFKLSQAGISKHLYKAIEVIYSSTECSVLVNEHLTEWFMPQSGVKQGDNLSPSLFILYIDDLARELNAKNHGIKINNETINILMYADDIVIVAESEENMQKMLDIVNVWCKRWRMIINETKSQIVHFRKKNVNRTEKIFKCGKFVIDIVTKYKYLGCILEEHLDFNVTANILAEGASRAVGSVVNTCIKNNNLKYSTFTKLYDTCVVPIMDYCAGVWGFSKYDKPNTVQNRAIRSFLGVHRYTSNVAINGDMGWTMPVVRGRLCLFSLLQCIFKQENGTF